VRQGCLPASTQTVDAQQALQVSQVDYEKSVKEFTAAEEYAFIHKLGIYSRPQDDVNFPKDRELIAMFQGHRDTFETLRSMAAKDTGAVNYLSSFCLDKNGLSESRRSEYVHLLSNVRSDLAITVTPGIVSFSYWGGALSMDHKWMKGVAYLPSGARFATIVHNLDDLPTNEGFYVMPIDGNWFVIYSIE